VLSAKVIQEVFVKKLVLLAGATLLMAACSESPTAPAAARKASSNRVSDDLTCRSGYVIAFDENGNPYCAPVEASSGTQTASSPIAPTTATKP
jgi:uncharacterized lipoprotein YajG